MPRILIVDDSPTEVLKLTQLLTKNGYDVMSAEDGEQGIAMARAEGPDVVLMDIVMPGLNGFQATRQLSRDPDTQNIPIIIVTTKNQETDRLWGERQGAKGYLTKPVDGKLLLNTIRELLPSF
ncbi:twitching motility response regulator PilH [Spongiibacter sp. KMU-158]|uniref:Twitching motility response regulator PilH n=1 Tax=Spongiibacter pelagi TaxID=2760804 RepID=A0A927BXI5_9GAMM|nr:twitching motility response regulator PilH [Spongiibacter pelagi]MBD2857383.1 twitching motility response regulator PilH [Spongiibacter pelagi]